MKYLKIFKDWLVEDTSNRVMSASDLLKKDYADALDFKGKWEILFGNPTPDFSIMFSGEPGSGKTTMMLEFAYYLASNFGKVLYISSEEYGAKTLVDKLKSVIKRKIYKNKEENTFEIPKNLFFAKGFSDLQDYDFVIVDSVTEIDLDIVDYRELRNIYPKKGFILLLQHTKAGDYRGSKEWEHEVSIYGEIDLGKVQIFKNRYGEKHCYDYFNDKVLKCEDL